MGLLRSSASDKLQLAVIGCWVSIVYCTKLREGAYVAVTHCGCQAFSVYLDAGSPRHPSRARSRFLVQMSCIPNMERMLQSSDGLVIPSALRVSLEMYGVSLIRDTGGAMFQIVTLAVAQCSVHSY